MTREERSDKISKARSELGERLRSFREVLRLSRRAFAEPLGFTGDVQQSYEYGRSEPSSEYWRRLSECYPTSDVKFLLTGHRTEPPLPAADIHLIRIPLVNRIPASGFVTAFDDVLIEDWVTTTQLSHKGLFALRVNGDSMAPKIEHGDVVILAPDLPFVNGQIYAVVTSDGEHTLKTVRKEGEQFICIPMNAQQYPPALLSESQIMQLIRVIEVQKNLYMNGGNVAH